MTTRTRVPYRTGCWSDFPQPSTHRTGGPSSGPILSGTWGKAPWLNRTTRSGLPDQTAAITHIRGRPDHTPYYGDGVVRTARGARGLNPCLSPRPPRTMLDCIRLFTRIDPQVQLIERQSPARSPTRRITAGMMVVGERGTLSAVGSTLVTSRRPMLERSHSRRAEPDRERFGTGKWRQQGVPHRGWTCIDIEDLGEPAHTCVAGGGLIAHGKSQPPATIS